MPMLNSLGKLTPAEHLAVRLLRCWSLCRDRDGTPMPIVTRRCDELGVSAMVGVAFTSLFQLYEQCLGRTIVTEHDESSALTDDERALLRFLRQAPELEEVACAGNLPQDLRGTLTWAAAGARHVLLRECGCAFPSEPAPPRAPMPRIRLPAQTWIHLQAE